MQFDTADIELMQHQLDALFDGRMVGAIAGDEFLDHGPQCAGDSRKWGLRIELVYCAYEINLRIAAAVTDQDG